MRAIDGEGLQQVWRVCFGSARLRGLPNIFTGTHAFNRRRRGEFSQGFVKGLN